MRDYGRNNFSKNFKSEYKKKCGRKIWTIVVFFLSVFLFLFIFKKILIKNSVVYEFISPLAKNNKKLESNEKIENLSQLLNEIEREISDKQGVYGWFVYNLEDGFKYGQNENTVFTAASINKLPIVASYLIEVEKGRKDLAKDYYLQKKDIKEGSGTLQYQEIGSKYSYSELLSFIGKYSDNTATSVIVETVGKNLIIENLKYWGMSGTDFEKNKTTPTDMVMFLVKIYKGEIFEKKETSKYFFDLFIDTEYEKRIPAGLSPEVKVSHKIGNQVQVWSDCGVIFSDKPYALCVLTEEIKLSEAKKTVPKISNLIWEFESK